MKGVKKSYLIAVLSLWIFSPTEVRAHGCDKEILEEIEQAGVKYHVLVVDGLPVMLPVGEPIPTKTILIDDVLVDVPIDFVPPPRAHVERPVPVKKVSAQIVDKSAVGGKSPLSTGDQISFIAEAKGGGSVRLPAQVEKFEVDAENRISKMWVKTRDGQLVEISGDKLAATRKSGAKYDPEQLGVGGTGDGSARLPKLNDSLPLDGSTPANPLGEYKGHRNLEPKIEGWEPHDEVSSFGAAMGAGEENAAALIQSGRVKSAQGVLGVLALKRYRIAGGQLNPIGRGRVNPIRHGQARTSDLYTPGMGYQAFLPEMEAKLNGGNHFVQKGKIPGKSPGDPVTEVKLTEIRTDEFNMANYGHGNSDISTMDLGVGSSGIPYWRHTKIENVPIIMDYVETLFQHAVAKGTNQKDTIDAVARMHWWLANATPYERGGAAISDAFSKSVLRAKGIKPAPWSAGVMPDIKAFHLSEEEFVACYSAYCAAPCPGLKCFFQK